MTLDQDARQAACDLLWNLWGEQGLIDELPADLRPWDRAEAYGVQAFFETKSAEPLYGWKIAATTAAGQAHIHVDGPIAGRLLAEKVRAGGAELTFGDNHMAVVEPEFAFRMGRDLPPRDSAYTPDEVVAAVDALHPALEIPDSRYRDFTVSGAAQLIADNACAHEFVLGPEAPPSWRDGDMAALRVRASAGDRVYEGTGANVLGDPRVALAWLANELSEIGVTLRAGCIVTTGTVTTPVPVRPGDRVRADFGVVGSVSLSFRA